MSEPKARPVVLFGAESQSRLAKLVLEHDAGREVVAITVNAAYVQAEEVFGLPVVPFETIRDRYPPESFEMLIPLGYRQMNGMRKERCEQAKAMGYTLTRYVSSRAVVAPGVEVRENSILNDLAVVQPFTHLGWNVTLRTGANIGHDNVVGDHTFVAPGAVTGGFVTIGERCWLGIGAMVRTGVKIADRTFVGMGAVVVSDTESDLVYAGNPARPMPGKSALEVTSRPRGHS